MFSIKTSVGGRITSDSNISIGGFSGSKNVGSCVSESGASIVEPLIVGPSVGAPSVVALLIGAFSIVELSVGRSSAVLSILVGSGGGSSVVDV